MGSREPNKSREGAGGREQANQAPPPKRAEPKPTKDAEKPVDAKGTGPNGNGGNGNGNGGKKNGGNGSANGGEGNGRSATSPLSKALVDGLVKVIGAFFTTAGFLTFVAVTGGAITWVRFWATKLPADQALQVVPRDDQIIVGAVALGLFTVLGVIAVAGVYAIDSAGRPTDGMRVALALLITVEVATAILLANEDVLTKVIALMVTVLLGVAAMVMTYFPMRENGALAVNFLTRRRDWLWEHIPFTNLSADAVTTRALPVFPTDDEVAEAKRRYQLFLEECETPALSYRRGLKWPAFAVAGVTTVAVSVAFLLLFGDDGFVGLGVAVAAVLAGISFGVAWGSGPRFWPYGLAVFFSVALFGAFINTARVIDSPEANPVALLRSGNAAVSGVVGLLVARTDDRYWLATVELECEEKNGKKVPTEDAKDDTGRIFSIPKSQVLDDEIGALTSLEDANKRASALFEELVARQPPGGAPTEDGERPPGASEVPSPPPTPAVVVPCSCSKPRIDRLSPAIAAPGQRVTAHGAGLRRTQSVTVGGRSVRIEDATSNRISFRAPILPGKQEVIAEACRQKSDPRQLTIRKKDVVPLLADTFFDVDQFELQEEGKPRLRRLRRRLRSQVKGIERIRLKGYADYTGSISHNDKLSRRRAREVRDFLLAGDILRRLMTYRGFGESEAEAKTRNDPRRKRDRRVDVIVIYK